MFAIWDISYEEIGQDTSHMPELSDIRLQLSRNSEAKRAQVGAVIVRQGHPSQENGGTSKPSIYPFYKEFCEMG
jgi:hypothetical protein